MQRLTFNATYRPRRRVRRDSRRNRLDGLRLREVVTTAFLTPPIVVLSLLVLLSAYVATFPERHFDQDRVVAVARSSRTLRTVPSLLELTEIVLDALDAYGVTYWLMPGAGLLPGRRVPPWREGLDFGVNQSHLMKVLVAQSETLQPRGIVAVESYFGLRVFPLSGYHDDRYDFRTPFVDLMYFQAQPRPVPDHVVNYCCDCEGTTLSVCTKKTCNCLVCALHLHRLFPLVEDFRIVGMNRDIPVPKDHENLDIILSSDEPDVHPALLREITIDDTI